MTDVTRIAICFIGAGSCYGNGVDSKAAIKRCWIEVKDFTKALGGFKAPAKVEIPIAVFDYDPYERITWSDGTVYGHETKESKGVQIDPVEVVWVDGHGKAIGTPAYAH